MFVVDANVLIHAVNADAADHAVARRWLDTALDGTETVGFAWIASLAFLRLTTHPAIFPRPLTVPEALGTIRAWLERPAAHVVEPGPRALELLGSLLTGAGSTAANLVNDAHLVALAIEHDATLVSFDTDFARFPGLRWTRPAT